MVMLGKVQKMYPCSTAFKIENSEQNLSRIHIKVGFEYYLQNPNGCLTVLPSLAIIRPSLDADLHLMRDKRGFGQGQRRLLLRLFHLLTFRSRPSPFPDA